MSLKAKATPICLILSNLNLVATFTAHYTLTNVRKVCLEIDRSLSNQSKKLSVFKADVITAHNLQNLFQTVKCDNLYKSSF